MQFGNEQVFLGEVKIVFSEGGSPEPPQTLAWEKQQSGASGDAPSD